MAGLVLIPGTHSWDNRKDTDWYTPDHPFFKMLQNEGLEVLSDGDLPFIWSTDADGVPLLDRKTDTDWAAGGAALCYFSRMHQRDEINVIAHSHGIHVALFAAAHHGIKIKRFMTFGSPIRKDMLPLAKIAKENIEQWWHVYSDDTDKWQWLGTIFDGRLKIVRQHPYADKNEYVSKVGHSRLLRDPATSPLWKERGWIDFLKGGDL